MDLIIVVLIVWAVVSTARKFVALPDWIWNFISIGLGILTASLAVSLEDWYLGLAAAGGVLLVQRLDDLMVIRTDEGRTNIMRRRS